VHVTARHFSARVLRITWLWATTTIWPWLRYSWTSKKPSTLYGTLACYTNYPNCTFRPVRSSLLAHSSPTENSVSVESKLSTPGEIQAGVPQVSVLAPTLYSLHINDTVQTPGVHLALSDDDTCIHATDRKESYVLRKFQRNLNAKEVRCELWNVKINEDKTQAIYFTRRHGPVEAQPTLKWRNILFAKDVKYLGVIFNRRITWIIQIETIAIKA
jgi:hypothetical protein